MALEFLHYLPAIQQFDVNRPLTKKDLLKDRFLIQKSQGLSMYYAPHNEFVNKKAIIIIVGITPGWNQMKMAFEQVMQDIKLHLPVTDILKNAKQTASFSGTMRTNLIHMLDQCGLPQAISIRSTKTLFDKNRHLLHTTSVIKYPVFYKNKNYTGHQPKIHLSKLLSYYAYEVFPKELQTIHGPALVIPLGKAVDDVISYLGAQNKLTSKHTYLVNFPHPSGANGYRMKQFKEHIDRFKSDITSWVT